MQTKSNVWFFHHYATPPSVAGLTRPFDFSKELQLRGHHCRIFSSSYLHYARRFISDEKVLITEIEEEGVNFVFVKSNRYRGNKFSRIINMIMYCVNLKRAVNKLLLKERPDIIIASSPHPLTCIAGIQIAKKIGVPCIIEIRDLWPKSIFAYEGLRETSVVAKLLFHGEKTIYKKANAIIFTMEGGVEYIKEKGWDTGNGGPIAIEKIHHINNGVDIETFDNNIKLFTIDDHDLVDSTYFKVIYAGSIRRANNLKVLLLAAKHIQENSKKKIKLFVFGDGNERQELECFCHSIGITNVIFKGVVQKKYIPYILSCADLNILHYASKDIWKYGGSQNKIFEYLASGKPVISTIQMGFDIILKYKAGVSLPVQSPEFIGNAIIDFAQLGQGEYDDYCVNARIAAQEYAFNKLANDLVGVFETINY